MDATNDRETAAQRSRRSTVSGCFYALLVIAISVAMLMVNALLCLTIYAAIPKSGDEQVVARIGQLFFFVAPVLLVIVEWDLLDRLQRLFRNSN
ncbi:MAG: hypothetical protein KDA45_03290 [Planctomycetales bacterium]|nr:hypothetical protein [Planctomycetales bacterium]